MVAYLIEKEYRNYSIEDNIILRHCSNCLEYVRKSMLLPLLYHYTKGYRCQ